MKIDKSKKPSILYIVFWSFQALFCFMVLLLFLSALLFNVADKQTYKALHEMNPTFTNSLFSYFVTIMFRQDLSIVLSFYSLASCALLFRLICFGFNIGLTVRAKTARIQTITIIGLFIPFLTLAASIMNLKNVDFNKKKTLSE